MLELTFSSTFQLLSYQLASVSMTGKPTLPAFGCSKSHWRSWPFPIWGTNNKIIVLKLIKSLCPIRTSISLVAEVMRVDIWLWWSVVKLSATCFWYLKNFILVKRLSRQDWGNSLYIKSLRLNILIYKWLD